MYTGHEIFCGRTRKAPDSPGEVNPGPWFLTRRQVSSQLQLTVSMDRTIQIFRYRGFSTKGEEIPKSERNYFLRCLKNSTCRRRFSASSLLLYGPPKFFPFSDTTLYPSFTFLIISISFRRVQRWSRS